MAAYDSKPVRMNSHQIDGYIYQTHTPVRPVGCFSAIQAGMVFPSLEGDRVILSADYERIVFAQGRYVYFQVTDGFVADLKNYGFIKGAQSAVGMARFCEITIDAMIGVASIFAGGAIGVALTTVDIMKWTSQHERLIHKTYHAVKTLLLVRATLKQFAPTLYDKIFDAVIIRLMVPYLPEATQKTLRIAAPALPAAATKPEALVPSLAKLVAKLGAAAAQGKLTILGTITKILLTVVSQVVKAVPGAISIKIGQYKQLAQDLITSLKNGGVAIAEGDVQIIFEEVARNGPRIRQALEDLKKVAE